MGWFYDLKKAYWDTSARIRHAFSSPPKSRQQQLDEHIKNGGTYENFPLKKGEVVKHGIIYEGSAPQGAKSEPPVGSGPSIMTKEGQRQYGKSNRQLAQDVGNPTPPTITNDAYQGRTKYGW